jgi:excisionase family DNA binding protein
LRLNLDVFMARKPAAVVKATLSTSEAAKYIGVSKKTLLKYCRHRHLVYMRYPGGEFRFRPTALDVFMARCTIQGEKAA